MSTNDQTRQLLTNHIWSCHSGGYTQSTINGSTNTLHVILMNPESKMCVDHIYRNRYDNRIKKLRIVTHQENGRNTSKQAQIHRELWVYVKEKRKDAITGYLRLLIIIIKPSQNGFQ